jgi:hypothetical protein
VGEELLVQYRSDVKEVTPAPAADLPRNDSVSLDLIRGCLEENGQSDSFKSAFKNRRKRDIFVEHTASTVRAKDLTRASSRGAIFKIRNSPQNNTGTLENKLQGITGLEALQKTVRLLKLNKLPTSNGEVDAEKWTSGRGRGVDSGVVRLLHHPLNPTLRTLHP